MSNVIAFHPPKSSLILLYEVVGEDGHAEWGGKRRLLERFRILMTGLTIDLELLAGK
jgi:hypothetical protein